MKKFMFAAMAALAITSCSQNEEMEGPKKAEIGFGTAAVTRGEVMVTDNFKTFTVFGYAHNDVPYGNEVTGTQLVDGVYINGPSWTENGGKTFYWPLTGKVTFFAYSPAVVQGNYVYTTGYPTVKYSIVNDIANQADFVVATLAEQTKESNLGKVSLSFKHALTQVVFKLKGEDSNVEYTITNLALKDIKNEGTFNYADNSWTVSTDPAKVTDYSMSLNKKMVGGDDNAVSLTAKEELLILMPQEVATTVEVTYSAKIKDTEIGISESTVKVANLNSTWEVGNKYVYTLVLKAGDKMDISGTVDTTWTPKDENIPTPSN